MIVNRKYQIELLKKKKETHERRMQGGSECQ